MQMGLQEWIHKLEEGVGVRYIKLALIFLALAGLTTLYDLREFKNFNTSEAMDAAQVGRNLAEGRGFTTRYIRPLSLALVRSQHPEGTPLLKEEHPDLANAPVYPAILAVLMKVLPFRYEMAEGARFWRYQPEVLIAIFNQFVFLAILLVSFRLAAKLFDPGVAWVSTLVLAASDLFWKFSVSGLPTLLLVLVFLGIVWCLALVEQHTREPQKSNAWFIGMAVAVGALTGLGALTRYSFVWLIIPVVGFLALYAGTRRVTLSLCALFACLAMLAPWLVRNYSISGTLFGTAGFAIYQETTVFTGNQLERAMPKIISAETDRVGLELLVRKLFEGAADIIPNQLPRLGGSWTTLFFAVGLLVPFRNPALSRLRHFLLGSLGVLFVAQALGKTHLSASSPEINSENLLFLMAPMAVIFGVATFYLLLDQIEFPEPQFRLAAISGFVIAMSTPFILTLLPPKSFPVNWPPYNPPLVREVGGWMKESELMMSDMPWAVAWYGDRRCLWLTWDAGAEKNGDFFTINDYQKAIQALYLTQLTLEAPFLSGIIKNRNGAWPAFVLNSMVKTNVPGGFPLRHAPAGFLPEQLFLSDRVRWKGGSQ